MKTEIWRHSVSHHSKVFRFCNGFVFLRKEEEFWWSCCCDVCWSVKKFEEENCMCTICKVMSCVFQNQVVKFLSRCHQNKFIFRLSKKHPKRSTFKVYNHFKLNFKSKERILKKSKQWIQRQNVIKERIFLFQVIESIFGQHESLMSSTWRKSLIVCFFMMCVTHKSFFSSYLIPNKIHYVNNVFNETISTTSLNNAKLKRFHTSQIISKRVSSSIIT